MKIDDLVFIDIEASGLLPQSWPIEVGLAGIAGGSVQTWSTLIQPHDSWSPAGWSEQSASVHGISRLALALDAVPSARDVAHQLADRLRGKITVCNDPERDYAWAATLIACIGGFT